MGKLRTVDEILEIVLRDRRFYEASGGGVTLSGGEPMAQPAWSAALLQPFQAEGLHTVVETSGFFPWRPFRDLLSHIDLLLFDLKIADPLEHRRLTGEGNETIMKNLERLLSERPEDVIVRIPLVPGYTASQRNIGALSERLRALRARRCSLLAYHPYGRSKAQNVGIPVDPVVPQTAMSPEELSRWSRFFQWTELVES